MIDIKPNDERPHAKLECRGDHIIWFDWNKDDYPLEREHERVFRFKIYLETEWYEAVLAVEDVRLSIINLCTDLELLVSHTIEEVYYGVDYGKHEMKIMTNKTCPSHVLLPDNVLLIEGEGAWDLAELALINFSFISDMESIEKFRLDLEQLLTLG